MKMIFISVEMHSDSGTYEITLRFGNKEGFKKNDENEDPLEIFL